MRRDMYIASYERLDEDSGKKMFLLTSIKTNTFPLAYDMALKAIADDQRPAGYCWSLVKVQAL